MKNDNFNYSYTLYILYNYLFIIFRSFNRRNKNGYQFLTISI